MRQAVPRPDPVLPPPTNLAAIGIALTLAVCSPHLYAQMKSDAPEATPQPAVAVMSAVPADALGMLYLGGEKPGEASSDARLSIGLVTSAAAGAAELGLFSFSDPSIRAWIDVLAGWATVLDHPHALVILDASAEPLPDGGHRLATIHAGLVVRCGEDLAAIEHRVQHLLTTYTNTVGSKLTTWRRATDVVHRLTDARLPDWATIEWGHRRGLYLVTIGAGTFERLAAAMDGTSPNLANDVWLAEAGNEPDFRRASVFVYLRPQVFIDQADPLLARKIRATLLAMRLDGLTRALWTSHYDGRMLEAQVLLERAGRTERRPIASARFLGAVAPSVVPTEADRVAAFQISPGDLLNRTANAYLATLSERSREQERAFWRDLQAQAGVSIGADIFAQLDRPIIVYDYPKHPLRIPLVRTYVVPIKGKAATLRRHIDAFLNHINKMYEDCGFIGLRRDASGMWYLTMGIAGPALTVTDEWLVLGYSPTAVRRAIAAMEERPAPDSTGRSGDP